MQPRPRHLADLPLLRCRNRTLFLVHRVCIDILPVPVEHEADEFQLDFRFPVNVTALFGVNHLYVSFGTARNYDMIFDKDRWID
jgi:hypothetical protein